MSDTVLKRDIENLEETSEEGEKKRRKVDEDDEGIIGPSLPVSLKREDPEENTLIKSDKRKINNNL